jgi:hypothetical protein
MTNHGRDFVITKVKWIASGVFLQKQLVRRYRVFTWLAARLNRLLKNSDFVRVLKGRGFEPGRKRGKISGGFSR